MHWLEARVSDPGSYITGHGTARDVDTSAIAADSGNT
jgi:hypothetical protein